MLEIENPEAVLFDMDGVLIDSFEAWFAAYNDTLQEFGKEEIDHEKFDEKCWGLGLHENVKKLGLGEEASEYCLSRYNVRIDKVVLLPKAKKTLELIENRKGLVTNTPKKPTKEILEKFDLDLPFEAVVSADEVDQGKPSSDPVIKACDIMEVNPEETILIGDSESDMKACRKVGCNPIKIGSEENSDFESIEELYEKLK